ncbi:MAG: uridine diphosphate-N-acetylglucosamine-binding protein YvcK [Chloroflexota bacterium]
MSSGSSGERAARLRRWLRPGTGIKRWLLVMFLGLTILATAGALIIRILFREVPSHTLAGQAFELLSLNFLPMPLQPIVVIGAGVAVFVLGLWRLLDVLLEPFPARQEPLIELVYQKRSLARGPRIVAIGGGTGLATLLRGLKGVSSNITAVVTVADDGGSSGKLRQELGVPPVGDIRNCIAALADAEPAMTALMQYRFPTRESDPGLAGHAFGNLLIAAMADIAGDFEEGVRLSNRVLAVRGQVVPVAPRALNLNAELADGTQLEGQSRIMRSRGIRRVWLSPAMVEASPEAVESIRAADIIVIGPGSLYTSLLPSLLVPGIRSALEAAPGLRVYVCNVATQPGETEGYTLSEHVAALSAHDVGHLIDVVLANDDSSAAAIASPSDRKVEPVRIDLAVSDARPRLELAAVVDPDNALRHDPERLTQALVRLLDERPADRPVVPVRSA